MEAVSKKKSAAQRWLSRASNNCVKAIDNIAKLEEVEYEYLVQSFNKRLSAWDELQTEYEQYVEDLEGEIAKAAGFREGCEKSVLDLMASWSKLHKQNASIEVNSKSSEHSETDMPRMNLPKLELPKFSGNVMEFTTFWQQFVACVDSQNYPDIVKFNYLVGILKGEARHVLDGLPITEENYPEAKKIIQSRYGRPETIIFSHVQSLLSLEVPDSDNVKSLSQFRDKLVAHVRALSVHDIKSENFGVILTPIIVSRMSESLRLEWSRDSENKEADLDFLMNFLDREISRRQRCVSFSSLTDSTSVKVKTPQRQERRSSAIALHTKSQNICSFCKRGHRTDKCYGYVDLPVRERQKKVETNKLCFVCLSNRHMARDCRCVCDFCGGRHHVTLCYKSNSVKSGRSPDESHVKENKSVVDNSNVVLTSSVPVNDMSNHNSVSLLPSAKVKVRGSDGTLHLVTLLFDSGSDRSYVSSDLVKKVKPKFVKTVSNDFHTFGGRKHMSRSRVFELCVKDMTGDVERCLQVTEVPVICLPLGNPKMQSYILEKFDHLSLAEDFSENKFISIDILIGQDLFWSLMFGNTFRADGCDVVAQESLFGWVLSGSSHGSASSNSGVTLLNVVDIPDNVVRTFWDLESLGVKEGKVTNEPLQESFNRTVTRTESGRYQVGLLWKDDPPPLLNNERPAQCMLNKLEQKLDRDEDLKSSYKTVLKEMEDKGYIVEVSEARESSNKVYYLPHRPHVRESSSSTKVRPVFNASFSGQNGVSLNDCLEQGPNLNPSVSEVLLRFRRWKYAVSADIQKAFLQIELQEKDQDVHRFLWRGEYGQIRKMKFLRVTFGINCSPFLLTATIRHHLSLFPPSAVIQELTENMYVDDFLSGADTEQETQELFVQAKTVMEHAGMKLTKWSSNESTIIDEVNADGNQSQKVLGMTWDQSKDCFAFVGIDLPDVGSLRYSKRVVLSLMALMVFDPLGFILPFTVNARFLFQDIWRLGVTWDEDLPGECQESFRDWLYGLELMKGITIPRQFLSYAWSDICTDMELHAFGDASLKGYGACVYLRYRKSDGEYESALVRSCARVAPLERKTLPRLELLGALVTAQLVCSVMKDLRIPPSAVYTCWTDSMVALGWIRSRPAKWKPWVANRVAQIQSLTDPERWRHVPGVDNPADMVTRGVSAEKLLKSETWWQGPKILKCDRAYDQEERSETNVVSEEESVSVESERRKLVCLVTGEAPQMIQMEKWSTLSKVYRILGLVLKFIGHLRSRVGKTLSYGENVKNSFVRVVQRQHFQVEINALESEKKVHVNSKISKFSPFVDCDGLLRVGGRIQLSELAYESKHPLILPKCHEAMLLVKFVHLSKNHAGVDTMITCLRANFEILGLRQIAKSVKRSCVSCKRFDARACNEPTAPLPRARVTRAPVFTVTGLDFAGPVFCLDCPGLKFYICLFVCGVVRAIHLELVDSLTSNDFILAFRRFAALKRVPSIVYSDNGKNLVGGQKKLSAYLGPNAPEWKFICPRSPWWGGWWERLVRSVKSGIRKTIGKECLTKVELQTCLCEVAVSINSRPLTFVGTDIETKLPLTPNHFLAGQGNQGIESRVVEDPENVSVENLCLREQEMLLRQEDFWKVWSSQYLRNLPQAIQKFKKGGNLSVGSVVLIKEDNLPRLKWALGIVERLHVGRDGIPRSVDLKTSNGFKTRPVQKLYDLEISNLELAEVPNVGDELQDEHVRLNVACGEQRVTDAERVQGTESGETDGCESVENGGVRRGRTRKRPVRFQDYISYD